MERTTRSRRVPRVFPLLFITLLIPYVGCRTADDATPDGEPSRVSATITVDMGPALEAGWFDPESEQVGLRGGFAPLSWNVSVPARRLEESSRFRATIQFPEDTPEIVPYKIKVEGVDNPNGGWEEGDNRVLRLSDEKVSVERSWGDPPDEMPSTVTGDVRVHESFGDGSEVAARNLHVWLPPGYDEDPERRYPVLYMHDGQNVFDVRGAGAEWRVDETALASLEAGDVEPFIVVGVENTDARTDEYTPTVSSWRHSVRRIGDIEGQAAEWAGRYSVDGASQTDEMELLIRAAGDEFEVRLPGESAWVELRREDDGTLVAPQSGIHMEAIARESGRVTAIRAWKPDSGGRGPVYAKFLVEEVKPFIDRTYRTLPGRDATSVGGSSFGGLITLYLGAKYPDTFGGLLAVSPAVWWDDRAILDILRESGHAPGQRIWLDMGLDEGEQMVAGARAARDVLDSLGWTPGEDLMYVEAAGAGHDEGAWAARMDEMLEFLYGE